MHASPYNTVSAAPEIAAKRSRPVTLSTLKVMKEKGEKITMLTAYDASFAALMELAGVDMVLVGDSLGNVIQGLDSTIPVTMEDMIYHARAVARGCTLPLRVVDMPFASAITPRDAVINAARLMQQGFAQVVKLEGGLELAPIIRALSEQGIPVCAHLGLLPQRVNKVGGYKVVGRENNAATQLMETAALLEKAGADMLLVECIPAALAQCLTQSTALPVIGIGAGSEVDAQVLVLYDILSLSLGKRPRFSYDFLQGQPSILAALTAYVTAVKSGSFPTAQHAF